MCGGREEGEGGGGGGGRTAAAAASPPRLPQAPRLPGPPLQQRREPPGPGPAAAAAKEEEAPAVFILGRPRRRTARGALQRPGRRAGCAGPTAPPGWSWLAGGRPGSARGWLGSGPALRSRAPASHAGSQLK